MPKNSVMDKLCDHGSLDLLLQIKKIGAEYLTFDETTMRLRFQIIARHYLKNSIFPTSFGTNEFFCYKLRLKSSLPQRARVSNFGLRQKFWI